MFIRPTKRTCHSKLQTSPEFGQQFVFRQSDVVGSRETTRNMRVQNCRGIAASCDESLLFSPNNIDKFVDPTHGETCWETALGDLPITLFSRGKYQYVGKELLTEAERIFILIIRPSICSSTEVKSKYPLY